MQGIECPFCQRRLQIKSLPHHLQAACHGRAQHHLNDDERHQLSIKVREELGKLIETEILEPRNAHATLLVPPHSKYLLHTERAIAASDAFPSRRFERTTLHAQVDIIESSDSSTWEEAVMTKEDKQRAGMSNTRYRLHAYLSIPSSVHLRG